MLSNKNPGIIFISETRHAISEGNKFIIRDSKNQVEKTYDGGDGYYFFKIKNSQLMAHVYVSPVQAKDRAMRRNAIGSLDFFQSPGKTTLIDSKSLNVTAEIPHPLMYPILMLEDQIIVGICGLTLLCCLIRNNNQMIATIRADIRDCIPITKDKFAVLYTVGSSLFFLGIDNSEQIQLASYTRFNNLLNICPLSNDRFFVKTQQKKSICDFSIYKDDLFQKINEIKTEKKIPNIRFIDLLPLPDNETIIARSYEENLYLIDTNTLNIEKISVATPKTITQLVLSETQKVIAVLTDGSYCDLEAIISNKKAIRETLLAQTTFPTVLVDMMMGYIGDPRFFKNQKPAVTKEPASTVTSLSSPSCK